MVQTETTTRKGTDRDGKGTPHLKVTATVDRHDHTTYLYEAAETLRGRVGPLPRLHLLHFRKQPPRLRVLRGRGALLPLTAAACWHKLLHEEQQTRRQKRSNDGVKIKPVYE